MIRTTDTPLSLYPDETGLSGPQLHQLLQRLFPRRGRIDRRQDGRYPFPFLVDLAPVELKSLQPTGESIVVVGKDLSEHGFGFFCQEPLACRHAIVTIGAPDAEPVRVLLHLTWCRFTGRGWYENGGRFLRLLSDPPQAA